MRKLKVLLVEDNDFTRSTVAAALRAEQCEVVGSVGTAKMAPWGGYYGSVVDQFGIRWMFIAPSSV